MRTNSLRHLFLSLMLLGAFTAGTRQPLYAVEGPDTRLDSKTITDGDDTIVDDNEDLPDTRSPSIQISGPTFGSTIEGDTLTIFGTATEESGSLTIVITLTNLNNPAETLTRTIDLSNESGTFNWSLDVDISDLSAGEWSIVAVASDPSGNTEESGVRVTIVGGTSARPRIVITSPQGGATIEESPLVVTGTASDDTGVTEIQVLLINAANILERYTQVLPYPDAPESIDWSTTFDVSELSDGTWRIVAVAKDEHNQYWETQISINLQRPPPRDPYIKILFPANNALVSADAMIVAGEAFSNAEILGISLKLEHAELPDTTITVHIPGEGLDAQKFRHEFDVADLPSGEWNLEAVMTSANGDQRSDSITVRFPPRVPTVKILTPENGASIYVPTDLVISGTAREIGTGVNRVQVRLFKASTGDEKEGDATIDPVNPEAWSITFPMERWEAGEWEITATAYSAPTTSAQDRITITLMADTEAPKVKITEVDMKDLFRNGAILIKGTASDNLGVRDINLYINYLDGTAPQIYGYHYVNPVDKGPFTWTIRVVMDPVKAGRWRVRARASDEAMNWSEDTVEMRIRKEDPPVPACGPGIHPAGMVEFLEGEPGRTPLKARVHESLQDGLVEFFAEPAVGQFPPLHRIRGVAQQDPVDPSIFILEPLESERYDDRVQMMVRVTDREGNVATAIGPLMPHDSSQEVSGMPELRISLSSVVRVEGGWRFTISIHDPIPQACQAVITFAQSNSATTTSFFGSLSADLAPNASSVDLFLPENTGFLLPGRSFILLAHVADKDTRVALPGTNPQASFIWEEAMPGYFVAPAGPPPPILPCGPGMLADGSIEYVSGTPGESRLVAQVNPDIQVATVEFFAEYASQPIPSVNRVGVGMADPAEPGRYVADITPVKLGQGPAQVFARVTDAAGNVGESARVGVNISNNSSNAPRRISFTSLERQGNRFAMKARLNSSVPQHCRVTFAFYADDVSNALLGTESIDVSTTGPGDVTLTAAASYLIPGRRVKVVAAANERSRPGAAGTGPFSGLTWEVSQIGSLTIPGDPNDPRTLACGRGSLPNSLIRSVSGIPGETPLVIDLDPSFAGVISQIEFFATPWNTHILGIHRIKGEVQPDPEVPGRYILAPDPSERYGMAVDLIARVTDRAGDVAAGIGGLTYPSVYDNRMPDRRITVTGIERVGSDYRVRARIDRPIPQFCRVIFQLLADRVTFGTENPQNYGGVTVDVDDPSVTEVVAIIPGNAPYMQAGMPLTIVATAMERSRLNVDGGEFGGHLWESSHPFYWQVPRTPGSTGGSRAATWRLKVLAPSMGSTVDGPSVNFRIDAWDQNGVEKVQLLERKTQREIATFTEPENDVFSGDVVLAAGEYQMTVRALLSNGTARTTSLVFIVRAQEGEAGEGSGGGESGGSGSSGAPRSFANTTIVVTGNNGIATAPLDPERPADQVVVETIDPKRNSLSIPNPGRQISGLFTVQTGGKQIVLYVEPSAAPANVLNAAPAGLGLLAAAPVTAQSAWSLYFLSGNEWIPVPVDDAGMAILSDSGLYAMMASASDSSGGATSFEFGQVFAFPNPAKRGANPVIRIEAPSPDRVSIRIYNGAGIEVHSAEVTDTGRLVNGVAAHEYTWDVSNVASDVYRVVISAKKHGFRDIVTKTRIAVIK